MTRARGDRPLARSRRNRCPKLAWFIRSTATAAILARMISSLRNGRRDLQIFAAVERRLVRAGLLNVGNLGRSGTAVYRRCRHPDGEVCLGRLRLAATAVGGAIGTMPRARIETSAFNELAALFVAQLVNFVARRRLHRALAEGRMCQVRKSPNEYAIRQGRQYQKGECRGCQSLTH